MGDPFRQYDDTNIFAEVLHADRDPAYETKFRKKDADIVHRDEQVLAFPDITPHAKKHVLVIPKKPYIGFDDFIGKNAGNDAEIAGYFRSVYATAQKAGVAGDFRLACNNGPLAGQTVPHLHFHILSGEEMPPVRVAELPHHPALPEKPKEVLDYGHAQVSCYTATRQPPLNYLVVEPKNRYADFGEFIGKASDAEIAGYFRALHTAAHAYGLGTGSRIISSNGKHSGQETPHFSTQVLIGMDLGPLLPKKGQARQV